MKIKLSLTLLYLVALCYMNASAQKATKTQEAPISAQLKKKVIDSLLYKLDEIYVFPDTVVKISATIRSYQKNGAYSKITDPIVFADTLTSQLRRLTNDKHLGISYEKQNNFSDNTDKINETEKTKNFQRFLIEHNFGFPKIDILEGNIGYIKIEAFGPVSDVGPIASAAMTFLNNTYALIIDLRNNHGGDPGMVQFLASFFFDSIPVHLNDLYWREGNKVDQSWTLSSISGKRYLDKPVCLLTSAETFSAGEEFAYDLQTLKRAIIFGEITGGGANPGGEVNIGSGFTAFIPSGRAINPITKTNWEGKGVKPDIQDKATNALLQAHIAVLKGLLGTAKDETLKEFFENNLKKIEEPLR